MPSCWYSKTAYIYIYYVTFPSFPCELGLPLADLDCPMSDFVWHCLTLTALFWPCMTLSDLVCHWLPFSDHVWPCLTLYYIVYQCMRLYALVYSCLTLTALQSANTSYNRRPHHVCYFRSIITQSMVICYAVCRISMCVGNACIGYQAAYVDPFWP